MDFVCKLYGNTYAVHVTVALVGVATLNLALPPPPVGLFHNTSAPARLRLPVPHVSSKLLKSSLSLHTKILFLHLKRVN